MKLLRGSDQTGVRSRRMLIVLPIAAMVIGGACWWKLSQEPVVRSRSNVVRDMRPAPSFTLPDQQSRPLRLDTYLHRHPVLVIFFDGATGPAANPWLKAIQANYPSVKASNTIVVGVSTALPQKNRRADFSFPLLTDLDPAVPGSAKQVHRQWGVLDESGNTVPSVFFINRTRMVEWSGDHPKAVDQPAAVVRAVLQGRNPENVL